MNFTIDETQRQLRDLAAELFERRVDPARIEKTEATEDRFDRELWSALAESGLLGVGVPEPFGGLGFGAVETALVLEQLGRAVAPVPMAATLIAATTIRNCGSETQQRTWLPRIADGSAVVTVAAPQSAAAVTVTDDRLSGDLVGAAWAHVADLVLVPVGAGVFLIDPRADGVTTARGETTAREVALDLALDGVEAEPLGGADAALRLRLHTCTFLAAVSAGITAAALRLTADYTSQREQFGKPLSTFQGVALKAADAYVDAAAIRAAALQAAWALDADLATGFDAVPAALTAGWWAAEAGQRCVHITQHLHGGMGADITYPVHRYFLWGKQIELLLGGASALLAELGDALAARPDAGDALVL